MKSTTLIVCIIALLLAIANAAPGIGKSPSMESIYDQDEACPICLDDLGDDRNQLHRAACNDKQSHVFHRSCIKEWALSNGLRSFLSGAGGCPMCRAPLCRKETVARLQEFVRKYKNSFYFPNFLASLFNGLSNGLSNLIGAGCLSLGDDEDLSHTCEIDPMFENYEALLGPELFNALREYLASRNTPKQPEFVGYPAAEMLPPVNKTIEAKSESIKAFIINNLFELTSGQQRTFVRQLRALKDGEEPPFSMREDDETKTMMGELDSIIMSEEQSESEPELDYFMIDYGDL